VYWSDPQDQRGLLTSPLSVPGFPSRAEALARYATEANEDLSDLDVYVAFAYWKLGCIVQGLRARLQHGASASGGDRRLLDFERQQNVLAELATQAIADTR
jgi:aminoglycoside phosphotransferase (APT) family kinase protein